MTTLVRDDAGGKAERVTDLMQVIAELTNECFFSARTGQEPLIGRQRIQGTKELEASDEFTHKGIHGDHSFCLEFAERDVNRPLIRAGGAQAVERQIGTFTDAHAGVANQQKDIATQIVAAEEFLLQEFVLLCRTVSVFRRPRPRRSFASGSEHRRKWSAFLGKDGGWSNFLSAAGARGFAEPESAKTKAQLGGRPDRRAPASESCGRAFGGERKVPGGSDPCRSTSGEVWKDRARGSGL